ncbi:MULTISPECIES: GntR family transcriptional regulator [Paenibacillus]|uniref:Transcriptional regulator, GntR family n=2 Tax=Paenibacillus lactis TaxID=228574 RepID=G4HDK8_9BACL|nr:GntR family transcriptional regulator [Paenibacillus lactis]EHB66134.1 transcriptional regulator, GntR family [Paenibacillus lactis 154]MBP1891519.1 GntR family transcriptional regulator of gluconate operon [Paenibacillus lactis]HAF98109.1 GntR family transcriptional regulator [Paenibacillus lactis]
MKYPSAWLQGASLGEAIASELRLQIISGTIKRGEVISENRIAGEFGTSRSPVREAMKTLSSEGLIQLERMGAVVMGLSLKDVEELYDVRYLIESFVQGEVFARQQPELIRQLRQIVDRMELAAKHVDPIEYSYQDLSFHERIITEANHKRILHLWKSIRPIVMTVMLITTRQVFSGGASKLRYVTDKHIRLIQEMESLDQDRIQTAVQQYFDDSRRTLHLSFPED